MSKRNMCYTDIFLESTSMYSNTIGVEAIYTCTKFLPTYYVHLVSLHLSIHDSLSKLKTIYHQSFLHSGITIKCFSLIYTSDGTNLFKLWFVHYYFRTHGRGKLKTMKTRTFSIMKIFSKLAWVKAKRKFKVYKREWKK